MNLSNVQFLTRLWLLEGRSKLTNHMKILRSEFTHLEESWLLCFFFKGIKQNKGSNSSSRTPREENNARNKNEKKSGLHLDTQLNQLVNQSHSPDADDENEVSRIKFHIDR